MVLPRFPFNTREPETLTGLRKVDDPLTTKVPETLTPAFIETLELKVVAPFTTRVDAMEVALFAVKVPETETLPLRVTLLLTVKVLMETAEEKVAAPKTPSDPETETLLSKVAVDWTRSVLAMDVGPLMVTAEARKAAPETVKLELTARAPAIDTLLWISNLPPTSKLSVKAAEPPMINLG